MSSLIAEPRESLDMLRAMDRHALAARQCLSAPRRSLRRRDVHRGATVVEMAFCVPVFFLVVLGLMEFSRMLQVQHTVRQAALEGARAGLTLDGTLASATAAATNITSAVGVISPTITVTPNPLRFFTAGKPITGTITMSREVQAISVP